MQPYKHRSRENLRRAAQGYGMQILRLEEASETDGDQRDLAYRAYWLIFWVIIFLGCGMAAAVASPMSRGCDLENLKHYPMSHAL
ncbi:hypothetical protein KX729_09405 [Rhizobium sp. XQZ8]|uniref:hypothetical protein n=1 Tax=Rhizobium populisoli TaxID=2859785 RepID=UPI001CA592DB|nr:hypothetical protein [Rhizobium populisoli]MBW6421656.1 hypothetical protein [Rhizobium populisoli]